MTELMINGSSDDLIEISGDIDEELYAFYERKTYVAFDDGTILSLDYTDDGVWRIEVVESGEGTTIRIDPATADDGNDENGVPLYSDRAYLSGDITQLWIKNI